MRKKLLDHCNRKNKQKIKKQQNNFQNKMENKVLKKLILQNLYKKVA